MLDYIKIVLLSVVVVLLSGCKEADSPLEHIANAAGVPSGDGIPPCFLRICNWTRLEPNFYTGVLERSKSQYLWAYLSDGSKFIDPSSIYFNNQPLKKLEDGQYEYYKHYRGNTESSNQKSCLMIAGLDGEGYNIIENIHDEIIFRNLTYKDTLDISSGITIEYSSFRHGNENALIDMQYDYYADIEKKKFYYYRQRFYVKDNNGVVHIPADVLKELPKPAEGTDLPFCTIELSRTIPITEYIKSTKGNNMLVGKVYTTSLVTHVYLKWSF